MYGLPGQTIDSWQADLEKVIELPITHISAYKLYVFKHGILHRENIHVRPSDETDFTTMKLQQMHDLCQEILKSAGFEQYTLTEYARPNYQSKYIRSCFGGDDILPLGPSSFGKCGLEIWDNSPYVSLFEKGLGGENHDRAIQLTRLQGFKRDVILGLWLLKVSIQELATRYGVYLSKEIIHLFNEFNDKNMITFKDKEIIVEPHQRFHIGAVMDSLSELPTSNWGILGDIDDISTACESSSSMDIMSVEINTLMRMARRDPSFFRSLVSNPSETLIALGYSPNNPQISELISTVASKAENSAGGMQEIWLAVRSEHNT